MGMARPEGGISVELWWWILPTFKTGLFFSAAGLIIGKIVDRADKPDTATNIVLISSLPLVVSGLALLVWLLCNVFLAIWGPYLK